MEKIFTNKAPEPIGPYSQAIKSGNFVFTSGQISLHGNVSEQTEEVIKNLKVVLEASGSSLERVVKTTVYLSDMENFADMNKIYEKYFSQKPARTTVEVSKLPKNALVEIEVVAEV